MLNLPPSQKPTLLGARRCTQITSRNSTHSLFVLNLAIISDAGRRARDTRPGRLSLSAPLEKTHENLCFEGRRPANTAAGTSVKIGLDILSISFYVILARSDAVVAAFEVPGSGLDAERELRGIGGRVAAAVSEEALGLSSCSFCFSFLVI